MYTGQGLCDTTAALLDEEERARSNMAGRCGGIVGVRMESEAKKCYMPHGGDKGTNTFPPVPGRLESIKENLLPTAGYPQTN